MEIKVFYPGDILLMKKPHPCQSKCNKMIVLMIGSDIKIKCEKCGHEMILPRVKLEKNIKSIIRKEENN